MSCLGRHPRLRLPAVNRFQLALDIWLDRLVVAGADSRSSPEAPRCSAASRLLHLGLMVDETELG